MGNTFRTVNQGSGLFVPIQTSTGGEAACDKVCSGNIACKGYVINGVTCYHFDNIPTTYFKDVNNSAHIKYTATVGDGSAILGGNARAGPDVIYTAFDNAVKWNVRNPDIVQREEDQKATDSKLLSDFQEANRIAEEAAQKILNDEAKAKALWELGILNDAAKAIEEAEVKRISDENAKASWELGILQDAADAREAQAKEDAEEVIANAKKEEEDAKAVIEQGKSDARELKRLQDLLSKQAIDNGLVAQETADKESRIRIAEMATPDTARANQTVTGTVAKSSNIGMIAGVVVGIIVFLIIMFLIYFFVIRPRMAA
jgi:hypothetical protein